MPVHIWDLFRDDPVIEAISAAAVRIVLQIALIAAGLWIARGAQK